MLGKPSSIHIVWRGAGACSFGLSPMVLGQKLMPRCFRSPFCNFGVLASQHNMCHGYKLDCIAIICHNHNFRDGHQSIFIRISPLVQSRIPMKCQVEIFSEPDTKTKAHWAGVDFLGLGGQAQHLMWIYPPVNEDRCGTSTLCGIQS